MDMANLEKEKLEYQKLKKALQLHTPSQLLNERIHQRRALALNEKEKVQLFFHIFFLINSVSYEHFYVH